MECSLSSHKFCKNFSSFLCATCLTQLSLILLLYESDIIYGAAHYVIILTLQSLSVP